MARLNIMLSDELHEWLVEHLPRGRRSALIERALREYREKLEREQAVRRLAELRRAAPGVDMSEVVELLRSERERA